MISSIKITGLFQDPKVWIPVYPRNHVRSYTRYLQCSASPEWNKMPDRLHMHSDGQEPGEKWQLPRTEPDRSGCVSVFHREEIKYRNIQ